MIARRKFFALGAGLTASLFAAGHSRLRPTPVDEDNLLTGYGLPLPEKVRMPAPSPLQSLRDRYAPPITDHHPDNLILDQIAVKPVEFVPPPGHSYHAVGDFDVGKKGFGSRNFSEAFAQTDEFKRLIDLGYLDIRYPQKNPFGVRYEPWHIKVV